MPQPHIDASNGELVEHLAGLVHRLAARLVVLDNLGLITGSTEENSANMASVMGNLRRLAESTGAAVVVIHHQRKGNSYGNSRAGDSLAGIAASKQP